MYRKTFSKARSALIGFSFLTFGTVLFSSTSAMASEYQVGDEIQLQILATSDMHGRFLPYDYVLNQEDYSGSCAQVATAVDDLRTEDTIVIDAGDIIQSNSSELFWQDDLHPMMLAMNEIGYDVWVAGNHDFDCGMDTLCQIIPQNNATLLCGNVYDEDMNPLADDYTIIERSGVKIAIIGMVSPIIQSVNSSQLGGWTVTDPVEETRKVIDEIEDQVDILIAVDHMDIDEELGMENSGAEDLAYACPELDLIIAAHGHKEVENVFINGVPIIENAISGETLAQILMDLEYTDDGWEMDRIGTKLLYMEEYDADETLSDQLQPYHERAVEDAETVIGYMDSEYLAAPDEIPGVPTARVEDSALIDFINEAILYYSGADVTSSALTFSDANIYEGEIRKCDISHIYRYSNTIYNMEMTGAQLKKWMEWCACFYNTYEEGDLTISFNPDFASYNYDSFSGVNYEINIANEPGSRIENLTWPDGSPVEDDDVFIAAVTSYRYAYLSSYGTVFEEGDELPKLIQADVRSDIGDVRNWLVSYISNELDGVVTASCDYNWQVTGNDWDEDLHQEAVDRINDGSITWQLTNGWTPNTTSVTVEDLL